MRYLLNTNNNRVLAYSKALANKVGVIECNENGEPIVQEDTINNGLTDLLRQKSQVQNKMTKELAALRAQLKTYQEEYGPLKGKNTEEAAETAEAEEAIEAKNLADMTEAELEKMLKADLIKLAESENLKVTSSMTKNQIIGVLTEDVLS